MENTITLDNDKALDKIQAEWNKAKEEKAQEDHVEVQKKTKQKQIEIQKTLQKVDKHIADLNLDVTIQINKVYLGLANDRDDYFTPN